MENNNDLNQMLEQEGGAMIIPRKGQTIKGKVVQIHNNEIVVNIKYKADGIIPSDEISNNPNIKAEDIVNEGDEVEVYVLKVDDGEGNVILSKKRVDYIKDWEDLEKAEKNKEIISIHTGQVVKGGILAYYNEIRGFIPASQLSDNYVENLDKFSNKELNIKVIEVDKNKRRAVFSHRQVLEEEKKAKREKLWATIEKDIVMKGEVKRLTNFGAFVDLGGIDGLIHISEMSWGRIKHPSQVVNIGDMVEVYIKDINKDEGKISLSLKQAKENPWSLVGEKYTIGDIVKGKVVRLVDFGAFVELEPGVEGLVHISQISENRISHPEEVLKTGQEVKVKILDVNLEDRKISLSIKEALTTENIENYLNEESDEDKTTIGDIIKFKEDK